MKKRCAAMLLCVLLLTYGAYADAPAVSCGSALLMEKETGTVLCEVNGHERLAPASVTKIMTLLLTMEALDSGVLSYDDTVTASAHAASMGGSQIWLRENEKMTVRELLKAVCIVSGNDAAVALAEQLAGSEDAFVQRMNERARELGMTDTVFVNCTGLPAAGHLTSAYDIALMSRELIAKHPDIRQFTTVWTDSLRGGSSMLVNTNRLIRFYDGATGLKTGSTDEALYCISATAERGGMELIAVVMQGRTSDARFADARALLDYGFANYALVRITPDEVLAPIPVTLGEKSSVQPGLTPDNALLVSRTQAQGLRKSAELAPSAAAPVEKGDVLGTLTVSDAQGETLAELPILALERVGRVGYAQLLHRFLRLGFGGDGA